MFEFKQLLKKMLQNTMYNLVSIETETQENVAFAGRVQALGEKFSQVAHSIEIRRKLKKKKGNMYVTF